MIIKMDDIGKIYDTGKVQVEALKNVSLGIEEGEFVSIMGPSGSGKSTLMNIIGCLDRSTSGYYELDGVNISELEDTELAKIRNKKIGFVFQSLTCFQGLRHYKMLSRRWFMPERVKMSAGRRQSKPWIRSALLTG